MQCLLVYAHVVDDQMTILSLSCYIRRYWFNIIGNIFETIDTWPAVCNFRSMSVYTLTKYLVGDMHYVAFFLATSGNKETGT